MNSCSIVTWPLMLTSVTLLLRIMFFPRDQFFCRFSLCCNNCHYVAKLSPPCCLFILNYFHLWPQKALNWDFLSLNLALHLCSSCCRYFLRITHRKPHRGHISHFHLLLSPVWWGSGIKRHLNSIGLQLCRVHESHCASMKKAYNLVNISKGKREEAVQSICIKVSQLFFLLQRAASRGLDV